MLSRIPFAVLAVTAAAGALAASPASAATGSAVVYLQDGDVWQVQPDGKNARAITTDGNKDASYLRPRLAPDGSVWALKEYAVVHFGADGKKLGSFTPARPVNSEGVPTQDPPKFLDVSPDGTKLAYGVDDIQCDDTHCNTDGVTAILDTTGKTLAEDSRFSEATFFGNDRLVGNDGLWEREVRLWDGSGASSLWYKDGTDIHTDHSGITREPAISLDGTQLAAQRTVTGVGNFVFTYKLPAGSGPFGLGTPKAICKIERIVPTGGSPSWSPDGHRLVVAQTDGLIAYDLSQVQTGDGDECAEKTTVAQLGPAGATQGDWGAIPVPDPPPVTTTTTTTATETTATTTTTIPPTTTTPTSPEQPAKPAKAAKAALTAPAQKLKAIRKSGVRVRLTGALPGKLQLVVKAKGKVVAKKTVTVPKTGTLETTVRLSKAGARALAKAKTVSLTISAGGLTRTLKV